MGSSIKSQRLKLATPSSRHCLFCIPYLPTIFAWGEKLRIAAPHVGLLTFEGIQMTPYQYKDSDIKAKAVSQLGSTAPVFYELW